MMIRMNAKELRDYIPDQEELEDIRDSRRELYLLLHDVQDTFNIGSFFRLGDAVGVKKIFLSGKSECPPNPRIEKASVGTHRILDWEYVQSAASRIAQLKVDIPDLVVVGVEQDERSVDIREINFGFPLLLIVGHESEGMSKEILDCCDVIVEMPMWGVNKSMNVLVSAAMVLSRILYTCRVEML